MLRTFSSGVIYQGSLTKGEDLIKGLTAIMKEHTIAAGTISGIGALTAAHIGYFNARTKEYEKKVFQEDLEIVSLKGNISFSEREHLI